MPVSAAEQYMLELSNRARLDPEGEAKRDGISLNEGLKPGTISSHAKQVLAYDSDLGLAAERHSKWMLETDTFSHPGKDGSSPGQRMKDAGYTFDGSWAWAENIALQESRDMAKAIAQQHHDLFLSKTHRVNLMNDRFREVGIAQVEGTFSIDGRAFNASSVTQDFAVSGKSAFITGVVYKDRDDNGFYSIGEGISGVRFSIAGEKTESADAGGYALATTSRSVEVSVRSGSKTSVVIADMRDGNVKLDLVDGNTLLTSGNLTLVSGVDTARLLGTVARNLTGGKADDDLTGNGGGNALRGGGGNDRLSSKAGHDRLYGDDGHDRLYGDQGNDRLSGGNGNDRLSGGSGDDDLRGDRGTDSLLGGSGDDRLRGDSEDDTLKGEDGKDTLDGDDGSDTLSGGADKDVLNGGAGRDTLHGDAGHDRLSGNSGADRLSGGDGNDRLWGGSGDDRLWGDAGDDQLRGGSGNDRLNGGKGNDVLNGESGRDLLIGESGGDLFIYENKSGTDRIQDFSLREGDHLQLDHSLWTGDLSAEQAIRNFDRIVDGNLVLDYGGGDTLTFEGFTDIRGLIGVVEIL